MQPKNDLELPRHPPPWNRPLAFLDLETTGLKAGVCDIIDAAVIRDGMPWHSQIKITEWDEQRADNASFRNERKTWRDVTGYNRVEWADAPLGADVAPILATQLHGAVWIGHNLGGVDLPFLRSFFDRHGIPFATVCCESMIDTYPLAKACLRRLGLTKFSLDACCEFLGLEREGVHRALGGAMRCRQLFHELVKRVWVGHETHA